MISAQKKISYSSIIEEEIKLTEENNRRTINTLLQLMKDVVPLLENVKNSIEESSKKIPRASTQLSKVTQATETAAEEILNVVETMTSRLEQSDKLLESISTEHKTMEDVLQKLSDGNKTFTIHEFHTACGALLHNDESLPTALKKNRECIANVRKLLEHTRNESMEITLALQVQDITSQQLAGVAHIIDGVQTQLTKVLGRFENGTHITEEMVEETKKTFDHEAEYNKGANRQNVADEIINQWNTQS